MGAADTIPVIDLGPTLAGERNYNVFAAANRDAAE
jgi:hypothetical protein